MVLLLRKYVIIRDNQGLSYREFFKGRILSVTFDKESGCKKVLEYATYKTLSVNAKRLNPFFFLHVEFLNKNQCQFSDEKYSG